MSELLPCPFCGGPVKLADNTGPKLCTAAHAYAFCPKRGCPGSGDEQGTVAEAIAAWNTRSPSFPELVAALEAALDVHGDGYSWGPLARAALAKVRSA